MIYIKLFCVAVFWGGTFIAGRIVGAEVGPFSAAFLRFMVAAVCLLGALWYREGRFPTPSRRLLLIFTGLGLSGVFAYNFFFFKGLQIIEAGRASIIIANNPIAVALFSALFFKERLTLLKIAGILLSVCGAVVAISRGSWAFVAGGGGLGIGEACIAMCVVSWVVFSLMGKPVLRQVSPLTAITWAAVVGALLLFPAALMEGLWRHIPDLRPAAWAGILYLGWFGTFLGFVWYYQGIDRVGPTQASLFINFVPISAILMAWAILDEPLTLSLLVGAGMVVTGVLMTSSGAPVKGNNR